MASGAMGVGSFAIRAKIAFASSDSVSSCSLTGLLCASATLLSSIPLVKSLMKATRCCGGSTLV